MSDDRSAEEKSTSALADEKIRIAKQLAKVVCICKGITLGPVLRALEQASTVEEVNAIAKTGSGNCQGERCGPRIQALLNKKNAKA